MIMATQGIRTRENLMNKVSTIDVCGQKVKNVHVGKALGLLISDDLTWKDQTEKVVSNCQEKMRGLWKMFFFVFWYFFLYFLIALGSCGFMVPMSSVVGPLHLLISSSIMYTVHFTLFSVHCTLHIVHPTQCNVQCTLYSSLCTVYGMKGG